MHPRIRSGARGRKHRCSLRGFEPTHAQLLTSGKHLSLNRAFDAPQAALQSCEISGYRVSVSVVDVSDVELPYLRGA